MEKYYVIGSDMLVVDETPDIDKNKVQLSMYCEIGSEYINPDAPPVFYMVVNFDNGNISISIDKDDFIDNESNLFKNCIDEFCEKIRPSIESIKLPPLSTLDIDDFIDITTSEVKPFWLDKK